MKGIQYFTHFAKVFADFYSNKTFILNIKTETEDDCNIVIEILALEIN